MVVDLCGTRELERGAALTVDQSLRAASSIPRAVELPSVMLARLTARNGVRQLTVMRVHERLACESGSLRHVSFSTCFAARAHVQILPIPNIVLFGMAAETMRDWYLHTNCARACRIFYYLRMHPYVCTGII